MQPSPAPAAAPRSPAAIARDIFNRMPETGSAWVYSSPYVVAMLQCPSWDSAFFAVDARELGIRFLVNSGSWRGPKARELKAEIKRATEGK